MEGGCFIRVRVTIDITKPLCRGRVVHLEGGVGGGGGGGVWVTFKFERLPNLCYWCGCLNHDDRECGLWIESKGTLPLSATQFGDRKSVV